MTVHTAPFSPRAGLRTSLTVYVVLPLIVVLAVLGWLTLQQLQRQGRQRLQSDIQLIARSIRLPVEDALMRGHHQAVQQALDSAFVINHVFGAYVYARDGHEIAAAGIARRGVKTRRAARIARRGSRAGGYGRSGSHRVYSYFIPLTGAGGRIIGLLQVTRRASDFRALARRVHLLGLLALAGLTLLLSAIVVYGHRRAIGRHLDRLLAGLARIECGERTHRLSTAGPQEIAAVSAGINAMLDSIAASERELSSRRDRQRLLEERLRESEKMAAIGRMAAGLAHELGSPLSVVDGKAQRLLRDRTLSDAAHNGLEDIRGAVERMVRLIRRLMEFGRDGGGVRRSVALHSLVRTACEAVAPEARHTGTELQWHVPASAPQLQVDAVRLEQALTNLLRNAVQASPGGRVRLTCLRTDNGGLALTVEDDGPGVAREHVQRIFEPFFSTKPVDQGTGLGLALAHGAVREHGGALELWRGSLPGAAFRLSLPPACLDD